MFNCPENQWKNLAIEHHQDTIFDKTTKLLYSIKYCILMTKLLKDPNYKQTKNNLTNHAQGDAVYIYIYIFTIYIYIYSKNEIYI